MYEVMSKQTEFLCLVIGKKGFAVSDERKAVVRDWLKSAFVTDLCSFMGLLQFFRRFIPKFSESAAPLTNLTRKDRCLSEWNEFSDKAFQTLKVKIVNALFMRAPDWSLLFRCHTDASQLAAEWTLTQVSRDGEHAISFFQSDYLLPKRTIPPMTANFSDSSIFYNCSGIILKELSSRSIQIIKYYLTPSQSRI